MTFPTPPPPVDKYIMPIYWDSQFLDLFFHHLSCGSLLSYESVCSTPLAEVSPGILSPPNELLIGPFEPLGRKPKKFGEEREEENKETT